MKLNTEKNPENILTLTGCWYDKLFNITPAEMWSDEVKKTYSMINTFICVVLFV